MARFARLETFARAGYAARGIVYLLLGYFALTTTRGEGTTSILERLHAVPAGDLLVLVVAAGLFGYGLFRITSGLIDLDDEGRSLVGIVTRIGLFVSGLAHWLLCYVALHVAVIGDGGSTQQEEEAARTAFEYPGGAALVGLVGLIIVVTGAGQLLSAWRGQFMDLLDVKTPRFTRAAGAAGYAARGAVFVVVGWQVISLAIGWGGRQLGMDSALRLIAEREWVFPFIAVGLIMFGIFSFIVAWYLRVRDEDV
ncbi:MAG TPA: DUF1206 domain-containing protein, partial [Allosphingosinicella sp.]